MNFDKDLLRKSLIEQCSRKKSLNLNLDNPKTIQDKINWLMVYDVTDLKSKCADKVRVHEYCQEKLGKDICVPIIGVYDDPKDIDFDKLPDKFVLKCNHGFAMNIICRSKTNNDYFGLNINPKDQNDCRRYLTKWLNDDFGSRTLQMHYSGIDRKCFAEKYLYDDKQKSSLFDYKFWCFNGKPMLYTINDGHGHGDICYFDMSHNPINCYNISDSEIKRFRIPKNFDLMVEYAEKLSGDFKFVRVDFYEVGGIVYLGEMTFTPGNGFFKYKDKKYDIMIGDMLKL